MTLSDLLFLVAMLSTVGATLRIAYLLLRKRRAQAGRAARRWAIFAGVYCAALLVTSMLQPRAVVALGEPRCFDEWCVAVDGATRRASIGGSRARGDYVIVSTRILNRGRGRRQRERDVYALLRDEHGATRRQTVDGQAALIRSTGGASQLTDSIDAGASERVELVFDVPSDAQSFQFMVAHAWFPHALIIGDAESVFHRPAVVELTPQRVP